MQAYFSFVGSILLSYDVGKEYIPIHDFKIFDFLLVSVLHLCVYFRAPRKTSIS